MTRIALPIACRADGSDLIDRRSLLADLQPVISGEALGPELTTNGDFAADTVWAKGTDWTISGGAARKEPGVSNSGVSEPIVLAGGVTYRVTYNASSLSGGPARPQFIGGVQVNGTLNTTPGVFSEDLVADAGNVTLEFFAASGAMVILESISVREVL